MAVSGLEQRDTPLIVRAPVYSPRGEGVLTPWSYDDDEDQNSRNPGSTQKERRRSSSSGGVPTFRQKTQYAQQVKDVTSEGGNGSPASPRSASHQQAQASVAASQALPPAVVVAPGVPASDMPGAVELAQGAGANSTGASDSNQPSIDPDGKPNADAENCDSVTTLAVRNLPFRITRDEFLQAVNETGFTDLYDYVYMPYKFKEHRNLGYVFINFVNVDAARQFTTQWHKSPRFKSKGNGKALNISMARVQGKASNSIFAKSNKMDRVKNSSFRPLMLVSESPVDVQTEFASASD